MHYFWYGMTATLMVSLISFLGILAVVISPLNLKKLTFWLVSLAVGVLFGDVFFHLLPELSQDGFGIEQGILIFAGLLIFLILERVICWRHCHVLISGVHPHPLGIMNLIGDGLHNFLDGILIGGSFLVSLPLGIATTLAVVFHEIPQEIADFGVLIHAGFSKYKAMFFNFLTALSAVLGFLLVSFLATGYGAVEDIFIPVTIGGFLYIAGSDLVPELKKEQNVLKSFGHILIVILGAYLMYLLAVGE